MNNELSKGGQTMDVKKVEARQELGRIIRSLKHTITDLEIVINALREDETEKREEDSLQKIIRERMARYE